MQTSNAADSTAPIKLVETPQVSEVVIRYAQTDADVQAIHRFLLVVAQDAMRAPVDPLKSLIEVIRVTKDEVALMAIYNGVLVGTMGIICPEWWYADGRFMTDRWHFVLPAFRNGVVNEELMAEALRVAQAANLEFIHQGKIRPAHGMLHARPRVHLPSEA